MNEAWYRLAMLLTLAVGFWEGPMAIIFRVFTDRDPNLLTAANYLPAPWCYLAAVAAAGAAFGLLVVLDRRHRTRLGAPPA